MTYELAKELKDAGFVLRAGGDPVVIKPNDPAYHPTLSELIEACGSKFEELNRIGHHDTPRWVAISYSCEECGWKEMVDGGGVTPEEAVARLWLALQKT